MNVERRTELYLLKPHRAGIGDPEIARVYQVEIAPSNDKQKNKEPQAAREIIARDAIYNTNFYADRPAVLPMTLISSKRLFLPPIVLAGARTFGNFNIVEGPLALALVPRFLFLALSLSLCHAPSSSTYGSLSVKSRGNSYLRDLYLISAHKKDDRDNVRGILPARRANDTLCDGSQAKDESGGARRCPRLVCALKERAGATKRGREEKSDDTSSRKNRKVDIGDGN